jgi:hypothetical protein
VLRRYCVPSILLIHELLLDGSQLFWQQVDMTLQALRNVRPSRTSECRTRCRRAADLFRALPPSGSQAASDGVLSREEAGGAVMSCRKVPAIRKTAQNTYALVQYEA